MYCSSVQLSGLLDALGGAIGCCLFIAAMDVVVVGIVVELHDMCVHG